jgi:chloramphenicol-sensitive protein RarD
MSSPAVIPAGPARPEESERHRRTSGLLAALACFLAWGLVPIYWKQIPHVSADEMVTHRVLWTLLFLGIVLTLQRSWGAIRRQWTAHTLGWAVAAGAAVSFNWWLFLWAVGTGRVIDTSLGYFLMPLFNTVVGLLFFRERMRPLQLVAVAIAAVGVTYALVAHAGLPLVGLALCASFGLYGVLRKKSHLDSLFGLFFETLAMAPVAVAWLVWQKTHGTAVFGPRDLHASVYLAGGGIVTAVPLLWFSHAARRLPLSTVGFLQYLSPSLSFTIGAALYHEPVTPTRLLSFAFVWAALALFTGEAAWRRRHAAGLARTFAETPEPPPG